MHKMGNFSSNIDHFSEIKCSVLLRQHKSIFFKKNVKCSYNQIFWLIRQFFSCGCHLKISQSVTLPTFFSVIHLAYSSKLLNFPYLFTTRCQRQNPSARVWQIIWTKLFWKWLIFAGKLPTKSPSERTYLYVTRGLNRSCKECKIRMVTE